MVTDVEDIIKRSQQGPQPPLTNVTKPYPNDVLCGRGGGSQNHIGNKEYRSVIAMSKRRYIEASRRHKSLLVESIVKAVRLQNPPGRFLEKDSKTGLWNDIGDKRAFAKVSLQLVCNTAHRTLEFLIRYFAHHGIVHVLA